MTAVKDLFLCLVCVIALGASPAGGATDSGSTARDHFAAGAQAFEAGEYAQALAAFVAAREAGLSGPSIDYNIGVCAWHLGRLDEAETAFLGVARTPAMAPLAHYNLGLVSLERGDQAGARRWFTLARDGTEDDRLRQLAGVALARLRPAHPAVAAEPAQYAAYTALHAGYDDNVVLLSDAELLGISGTASPFLGGQFSLLALPRPEIQLEASLLMVEYTDLDEFSQLDGQLGIRFSRHYAGWRGEAGAHLGHSRLDGDALETRYGATLAASRRLGAASELRLHYRLDEIDGREPFETLTGTRHQVGLQLRWTKAANVVRMAYLFETNDRDDPAVSPDRHLLQLDWRVHLRRQLQARLGASLRSSRFDLDNGADRSERRWMVSGELVGELPRGWQWTAGYDWTRNRTAAAEFRYSRNRVVAGVQRSF